LQQLLEEVPYWLTESLPPISVSSAVEGIRTYYPDINTVPIVIGILFILFTIQQFGTKLVGKFFAL
jgi:KUP system potassium uptake protein